MIQTPFYLHDSRVPAVLFFMMYSLLYASLALAQDDLERVFHFTHVSSAQSLQEIATIVRTVPAIRDLKVDTAAKTITFRASPEQSTLADWLLVQLDGTAAPRPNPPMFASQIPGAEGVVEIFHLRPVAAGSGLPELAKLLRSLGEIRCVLAHRAATAIVVRGTPEQVLMADWLVAQLDRAVPSAESEFALPGASDDFVHLFYLPPSRPLQAVAVKLRKGVFTYPPLRAVAVRGTAAEIAVARKLISQ